VGQHIGHGPAYRRRWQWLLRPAESEQHLRAPLKVKLAPNGYGRSWKHPSA